jgi:hypothetical protein
MLHEKCVMLALTVWCIGATHFGENESKIEFLFFIFFYSSLLRISFIKSIFFAIRTRSWNKFLFLLEYIIVEKKWPVYRDIVHVD